MRGTTKAGVLALCSAVLMACVWPVAPTETPVPTNTPTPTATPTRTPKPTHTSTPTSTPTAAPTFTPELTHTPLPPMAPTVEPMPEGPSLGDTWIRPGGAVMVYVPGGEFQMGSTDGEVDDAMALCQAYYQEDCERWWFEQEQPAHTVVLDGFWIDQTEVSVAQFRQFVRETGYETKAEQDGWSAVWIGTEWWDTYGADWRHPQGPGSQAQDDHPVVQVSWNDALAYCDWAGARLPTEAEWEYAARGPEGRMFPWGDTFDEARQSYCDANCTMRWADMTFDDGYVETAPVGSFPGGVSWCGAQDLAGNVWEWTADWFREYTAGRQVNPTGPASGEYRMLRGGSWYSAADSLRGAYRIKWPPYWRDTGRGFRCVSDPE